MDIQTLRKAAQILRNEQGEEVVQIPMSVWKAFVGEDADPMPQHLQIRQLLAQWALGNDDTSDEWWDEFDTFLRDNRVKITERETHGNRE